MNRTTIPGMKLMVVNLARDVQRLVSARELFSGAGLDFIRADAVDASRLSRADLCAACPPVRFYLANARRARPGEIACALSHRKCWQEAFADGTPLAAVFEDDVLFDDVGLRDALRAVAEENDPSLPTVWLLNKGLPKPKWHDLSARWYDIRAANDVSRVWGTYCYVLNAAAARRLADILTPLSNVIDAWPTFARCGVRVLAAYSPCATTREGVSSIGRKARLWRFGWVRAFYWFRYRVAFRLDLLAKRLSGKCRAGGSMLSCAIVVAASMMRFLDPYTSLYQTDDDREGRALSAEPGFWSSANGQKDPLAKTPKARILYSVFRQSGAPLEGYDKEKASPLFKVNQVGYAPGQPKFAYIGAWLGPKLGAWKPRWREEVGWEVVDAKTRKVVYASSERPLLRVPDATTKEGTPFTGEETYEMDFSSVTNEGTYFVRIPSVGRSANFRIWRGAAEDAFRVHMGGLYQKRCGIAKTEPYTHWTAGLCHTDIVRGTFAPEEGKLPKDIRWFDVIRENTDWENGEKIAVAGGWHDAADYDRRPEHLNIVNDLCAVYLMKPDNFRDGQLAIPENENGLPDILDEAEWGLRHLLAVQQRDGGVGTWIESTGHPGPGNVVDRDTMPYAVSRATRASSLAYAAHAALLARCHPAFRAKYLDSAKRAWDFAVKSPPAHETFFVTKKKHLFFRERRTVEWSESTTLPARALVKAAVNLAALTGDRSYLDELEKRKVDTLADFKKNEWGWCALSFAGERALGWPPEVSWLAKEWERKLVHRADDMVKQVDEAYAYRCPWWFPGKGWCHAMSWGQSHPLRRAQTLVAAHAATGKAKYLAAAYAALDFHNGCNPQGTTLTSGLGRVYPVSFLDLPSYVDGIAEYVPGITPYRWNYGVPAKAVEMVYGGDKALATKCPIWRRWGNIENQTVAASEYTVWETIAPAASVCGYLLSPTGTPPPVRPRPANDVAKLPGYWTMP